MLLIEFCPNYLSALIWTKSRKTVLFPQEKVPNKQALWRTFATDSRFLSIQVPEIIPPYPSRQCPNRQGDIYKSGSRRVLGRLNFQRTAAYIIIHISIWVVFFQRTQRKKLNYSYHPQTKFKFKSC